MRRVTVYLIGLPGSGKTTLGLALAAAEGWGFCDLDAMIEEEAGTDIGRIFSDEGEEGFRRRERRALAALARRPAAPAPRRVVSTGGGIVEDAKNRACLRSSGRVVFIDRPVEAILSTLDASRRPLLAADPGRLRGLAERRRGLYEACCHHRIDNRELGQALEDLRLIARALSLASPADIR